MTVRPSYRAEAQGQNGNIMLTFYPCHNAYKNLMIARQVARTLSHHVASDGLVVCLLELSCFSVHLPVASYFAFIISAYTYTACVESGYFIDLLIPVAVSHSHGFLKSTLPGARSCLLCSGKESREVLLNLRISDIYQAKS